MPETKTLFTTVLSMDVLIVLIWDPALCSNGTNGSDHQSPDVLDTLPISHYPLFQPCSLTMVSNRQLLILRPSFMSSLIPRAGSACWGCLLWRAHWWKWSGQRSLRTGRYFKFPTLIVCISFVIIFWSELSCQVFNDGGGDIAPWKDLKRFEQM